MAIIILPDQHGPEKRRQRANEDQMDTHGPPERQEAGERQFWCVCRAHPDDVPRAFIDDSARAVPICPTCRDMNLRLHNAGLLGKALGETSTPGTFTTHGAPAVSFVSRHGKRL